MSVFCEAVHRCSGACTFAKLLRCVEAPATTLPDCVCDYSGDSDSHASHTEHHVLDVVVLTLLLTFGGTGNRGMLC